MSVDFDWLSYAGNVTSEIVDFEWLPYAAKVGWEIATLKNEMQEIFHIVEKLLQHNWAQLFEYLMNN